MGEVKRWRRRGGGGRKRGKRRKGVVVAMIIFKNDYKNFNFKNILNIF